MARAARVLRWWLLVAGWCGGEAARAVRAVPQGRPEARGLIGSWLQSSAEGARVQSKEQQQRQLQRQGRSEDRARTQAQDLGSAVLAKSAEGVAAWGEAVPAHAASGGSGDAAQGSSRGDVAGGSAGAVLPLQQEGAPAERRGRGGPARGPLQALDSSLASAAAAATVLTDVIWLMPFLVHPEHRIRNSILYLLSLLLLVAASQLLALVGEDVFSWLGPAIPAQKAFQVTSAAMLCLYGAKLFWDSRAEAQKAAGSAAQGGCEGLATDCPGDEDKGASSSASAAASARKPAGLAAAAPSSSSSSPAATECTTTQLVLICVLGSLDNIAIFSSLIASGAASPGQLAVGTLASGVLVCGICFGASSCRRFVEFVERVPFWLVVCSLASLTVAFCFLC